MNYNRQVAPAIYLDGRVVATVEGDTLIKHVHKGNEFRSPPGWGMNVDILQEGVKHGATKVLIFVIETGEGLTAPLDDFLTYGIERNFGYGLQRILPLGRFKKTTYTPKPSRAKRPARPRALR